MKDFGKAFLEMRELLQSPAFKDRGEESVGNMFMALASWGGTAAVDVITTTFFDKYTKRLFGKYPGKPVLNHLLAIRYLLSNNIGYSIGHAKEVLLAEPENPLGYLTIGIAVLHVAGQKRTHRKPFFILQAFAFFFRYLELSKESGEEEATYNVGRAFHFINLLQYAIVYYEKTLALPATATPAGKVSRKPEAAFNLAHIYAAQGSTEMAQLLFQKYCSI